MSKTTKTTRPIRALQLFNKSDVVKSITLKGRTALADIEIDKNGDVDFTLKSDNTKADKTEVQAIKEEVQNLKADKTDLQALKEEVENLKNVQPPLIPEPKKYQLTTNNINEKSLIKRDILGSITTDKNGYNFIKLDYEKDYNTIKNVFTNSSEYTTTMRVELEVKYNYKDTTRSFKVVSTLGTPSKNGTSHYSLFALLPIGKMLLAGYDQKYKVDYKNTFNLALELLLPPKEHFADKLFLTTKNVLINLNSEMLVKNKETIFNLTDDTINSITITPKAFIVEQTITNSYNELI